MTRFARFLVFLSPSLWGELHERQARANTAEIKARGWHRQLRENGIEPTTTFVERSANGGEFVMLMTTPEEPKP